MSKAKIQIFILIILFIAASILAFRSYRSTVVQDEKALWPNYTIKEQVVDGKKVKLIVADTPDKWSQGLMYVRKPANGFDGMIFIFPDKDTRFFWNKNTLVDLKLYWLDGEKIIGTSDLPSIEKSISIVSVNSPGPADKVIEIIR